MTNETIPADYQTVTLSSSAQPSGQRPEVYDVTDTPNPLLPSQTDSAYPVVSIPPNTHVLVFSRPQDGATDSTEKIR